MLSVGRFRNFLMKLVVYSKKACENPDIMEVYQFIRITFNSEDAVELAHLVKAMD